jgi:hypothetical protein
MSKGTWATGLGIVSLVIGGTELIAPAFLARKLGLKSSRLISAFGAREIAAGVGLLSRSRKGPWVAARIAGDALDVAVLASAALRGTAATKPNAALAMAAVAPIVAADLLYGIRLGSA